jgi:hypothetical protein
VLHHGAKNVIRDARGKLARERREWSSKSPLRLLMLARLSAERQPRGISQNTAQGVKLLLSFPRVPLVFLLLNWVYIS